MKDIKKINEDIIPTEVNYKSQLEKESQELKAKLLAFFDKHKDTISNVEIYQDASPSRRLAIWYPSDCTLWSCIYKNAIKVTCYVYNSDSYINLNDEKDEWVGNAEDCEEHGIFTDEDLYDVIEDVERAWEEEYSYFDIYLNCVDSPEGNEFEGMSMIDLGYEQEEDVISVYGDNIDWIFNADGPVIDYSYQVARTSKRARDWAREKGLIGPDEYSHLGENIVPEPTTFFNNFNVDDVKYSPFHMTSLVGYIYYNKYAEKSDKWAVDGYIDGLFSKRQENMRFEEAWNLANSMESSEKYSRVVIGVITEDNHFHAVFSTGNLIVEDIDQMNSVVPFYQEGGADYIREITNMLDYNIISDVRVNDNLSPQRQRPEWYCGEDILHFVYDNKLEIDFYAGGEVCIPLSMDASWASNDDWAESVQALEVMDMFTDKELDTYVSEIYDNNADLMDNNSAYFGFRVKLIGDFNNEHNRIGWGTSDMYNYDLGYDDWYYLEEFLNSHWLHSFINTGIPELIDECDLLTDEEVAQEEAEAESTEVITIDARDVIHEDTKSEKKLTKQQVLNDVVNTFGTVNVKNVKNTDAIYILPNGNILDTKGPYDNNQHENISKYVESTYKIKDKLSEGGSKFMNSIGAIRVTPWIPGIVVTNHKLTDAQEETLYNIIKVLSSRINKDNPLMITTSDGKQFIEYAKVKNPEEVTTSILGYQIFGILKEHLAPGQEFKFLNKLN